MYNLIDKFYGRSIVYLCSALSVVMLTGNNADFMLPEIKTIQYCKLTAFGID